MLEVSTLRSPNEDRRSALDHGGFPAAAADSDFIFDDNLLDYIDFSCDVPFFADDGDILPDLEVDPTELLAEFSPEDAPAVNQAEPSEGCGPGDAVRVNVEKPSAAEEREKEGDKEVKSGGDEGVSAVTTEDSAAAGSDARSLPSAEGHSKRKPPSAAKNSQGKRKVKVDWTPELHRRFVQAVEQLGIDKAVPSRILELMGIECLTRHNIASHLQKYRSHRKHLLAREAEAAGWAQKRQLYTGGHGASRKDVSPWLAAPTMGFPHPPPPPPAAAAAAAGMVPPFRPLHVWGHPTAVEPPPMLPLWPRHLAPQPLPPWAHQPAMAPQPADAAYWLQHYSARKWAPQAVTQGTPCMPPPVPAMLQRFPAPAPVAGMVAHPMYRPMPPPPPAGKHAGLQLPLDAHPSKDSIDAAIGDVLVKPWLPLPLGLKPPSMDSVMAELHKQGIPKVPPASGAG